MDKRSASILIQLARTNNYITVEELANALNVSRRTIYNDIDKINDWLRKTHNSQLRKSRGRGLYILEDDKQLILSSFNFGCSSYYEYSKKERVSWIFLYLAVDFNHSYFIKTFQSILKVSRNTIIDDIKQLKSDIKTNDLIIESDLKTGYYIYGKEYQVRKRIIKYVQDLNLKVSDTSDWPSADILKWKSPPSIFNEYDTQLIENLIGSYEKITATEITDDIRPTLLTWLAFFIKRIRNGYYISVDHSEKEVIESSNEFKIVYNTLNIFSEQIPIDEIVYLTRFILGAKIKYSKSSEYVNEDMLELEDAIKEMIENFQQTAAVHFFEKDALFQNLLLHMKPAYYRIKYQIDINNPLKDKIKENYREIYFLTKQAARPLEDIFHKKINDDELAYIAIHFGGWLKRNDLSIDKRILRILLVCTNGIGTSRIMENQMIRLLPEYEIVSLYSEIDYNNADNLLATIDFVVSSIPLSDKGVSVLVVNPLFSKKDKEKLISHGMLNNYVYKTDETPGVNDLIDIIERHAMIQDPHSLKKEINDYLSPEIGLEPVTQSQSLRELLPISRTQVTNQVEDWKSAIHLAAAPLKVQKYIQPNYIDAMIDIINEKGPYMVVSDGIAFPHALPSDGVLQTGISLLLVNNGVMMEGRKMKLFIVLASSDNENHLKAVTELTRIFSDKERREKILSAENEKQIIEELNS